MEKFIETVTDKIKSFDSIDLKKQSNILIIGGIVSVTAISGIIYAQLKYPKKGDLSLVRPDRELLHDKFQPSKVPEDIDVIIIGSGMGGLSCGAILSRLGRKVLVLEQHDDVVGGGTHMFTEKGYRFDSGLHYTVPWSVPVFALTCLKKPKDIVPFDLMDEGDGTQDKIYLSDPTSSKSSVNTIQPFNMKYKETHLKALYEQFPEEKQAIDQFMILSDRAMLYVKFFLFARLLPRWMQTIYWKLVPSYILKTVDRTAKEILPELTSNKRLIALLSSMWIDTGARPDKATFMLTASVFRGISMEGGCYPRGGSDVMAKELVPVIESFGGRVLIRAQVDKIIVEGGRARGVRMIGGQEIRAKRAVVSGACYAATVKLLEAETRQKYKLPLELPAGVKQSAGFVMCNIGIKASAEQIGASNTNTWHIPISADGDAFGPIEAFFNNPLGDGVDIPVFITFPSTKDADWVKANPNKTSVQMLIMAEYAWFEKFLGENKATKVVTKEGKPQRTEGYDAFKQQWTQKCLALFLKYFPKAKDFIEYTDLSTPLSIEQWLHAKRGGAVGLDVIPERFCDPEVRRLLDPVTDLPGFYMTGQDTAICGVTLCQIAGVITAFRMEGFFAAAKILGQSIVLGN